jgi:prepilin-type N-terminal cleavage/methylation domain-containing protein
MTEIGYYGPIMPSAPPSHACPSETTDSHLYPGDCLPESVGSSRTARNKRRRGLTLVEVMVSLTLLATIMLGFISAFLQSRRITESSVLHAAASSLFYGVVEQIKGLSYTELLPSTAVDNDAPIDVRNLPPYMRIRINQDVTKWLRVVYTPAPGAPKAPTTTPAPTVTAASIGAIDNNLGNLPLSTVTGTTSQDLSLNLWIWIDEIPKASDDVSDCKKITIVYTYSYMDGGYARVIRNREVFLRSRYDK